MAAAPPADQIARKAVTPARTDLVEHYIARAAGIRRCAGSVRVALTPMHGVGGTVAVETLRQAGFTDVHTVATQFEPDPDFPTVAFPNPEEPGATDALLELAAGVRADVAIALDPDADRCAVAIPTSSGWRMLSGDETGWLLGDYILSKQPPGDWIVASTLVSSRMLAAIAADYGVVHVQTLTGFKWLARADADRPGTLVYAYEEAIGHCGPHRRAGQRRHQRRRLDVRSGGQPRAAGPIGSRCPRRPRPPVRSPRGWRGSAPGCRCRPGRGTDASAA